MRKRTVKKAVSAVMAAVLTAGTVWAAPVGNAYAEENAGLPFELNEEYATVLHDDNYDACIPYKDGFILADNASTSSYSEKSTWEFYTDISAAAELTYVNNNGTVYTVSNRSEDGTAKYDEIYHPITASFYEYTEVSKNDKRGLINEKGQLAALGGAEWYDEISFYTENDEAGNEYHYYGLRTYVTENSFDFKLVKEDGKTIFKIEDCASVEKNDSYFIFYNADKNIKKVIDFRGNSLHTESQYQSINYIYSGSHDSPIMKGLVFQGKNSYECYFFNDGRTIKGTGTLQVVNSTYTAADDYNQFLFENNGTTCILYDSDGNKLFDINGSYASASGLFSQEGIKGLALRDNNDKVVNVCDSTGKLWFAHDMRVKSFTFHTSAYKTGGIFTDNYGTDDAIDYYVSYGGIVIKPFTEVEAAGMTALKDLLGENISVSKHSYNLTNAGILFTYTVSQKEYMILVTKESSCTQAIVLEGATFKRSSNEVYAFILANQSITLPDGTVKECKYQIANLYDLSGDKLQANQVQGSMALYTNNTSPYNLYSISGKMYDVKVDGTYVEKGVEQEEITKTYIGNMGTYFTYSNISGYKMYGSDGMELEKGIKELYNNDNIKSIYNYDSSYNKWSKQGKKLGDMGYTSFSYDKKLANNYEYYKVIYTYSGETVVDCGNMGAIGKNGIFLYNNYVIKLKNLCQNSISDIISNTDLKLDTVTDIDKPVISGIGVNVTVDALKEKFANENIQICDSYGKALEAAAKVGTGCIVQLISNGTVADSAVVVIKGDTDGTGTVDVLDMEAMQKSILGISKLAGVYKNAAMITADAGNVSVLDMEAVQKDILGIAKIK